jgi:hypothetical protein
MKKYLLSFITSLIIVSCAHKDEVNFKLPEIPYATAGATPGTGAATPTVKKKEFTFPSVPYAE